MTEWFAWKMDALGIIFMLEDKIRIEWIVNCSCVLVLAMPVIQLARVQVAEDVDEDAMRDYQWNWFPRFPRFFWY